VLPNFLIGLREGLEAALIVSILVAYLGRLGRRDLLPKLWIGISAAIALALGVGALLTWGPYTLTFQAQETIGGSLSIVAVGLVTWMILWMSKHARNLKSELQSKVDVALGGSATALVVLGVVSVGREGLETAFFVWASLNTGGILIGFIGTVLGILTAVALAVLISLGVIRINLGRFFTWTGALLVVVAAGVLAYGIGDLQEAGVLPGVTAHAFSIGHVIPPTSWYGALLSGLFNLSPEPTWLQVVAWVAYVVVVGAAFAWRQRRGAARAPATVAAAPPVGAASH
jgi:high-affinity iron transporter